MRNAIVALGIVCVVLIGVTWYQHSSAAKELKAALAESARLSNQCEQVNLKLTDQTGVNTTLTTNLAKRGEELAAASNQIAKLKTSLAKAEEAAQAARLEIQECENRASGWETSHGELAQKANELRSSLDVVELEIAGVKKKLDASEGDRAFLLKGLKLLQAERDQLDRQFHDLAVVRAQFERLKNDKVINKRFASANTSLKVELQQDGSVRLVPAAANAR